MALLTLSFYKPISHPNLEDFESGHDICLVSHYKPNTWHSACYTVALN